MNYTKKKNKFKFIIPLVIVALIISVFAIVKMHTSSQGYRTISVIDVSGTVSVVKDGIEYPAYVGMHLQEGYEIITSGNSYVRLALDGDKYVKLESGSRLVFEKLGLIGSGKTNMKLERGALTSELVNPLAEDEEFVVNTPNAVLAVRGTFFRVNLTSTKEGEIVADVTTYGGAVASNRVLPTGEIIEEDVLIEAGFRTCINMDAEKTVYLVDDIEIEEVKEDTVVSEPVKIEDIPDEDIVDIFFAVQNGHALFVTEEEMKACIEERKIKIEENISVYEKAEAIKTVEEIKSDKFAKADIYADDSKPIEILPEETDDAFGDNNQSNGLQGNLGIPVTDGDGAEKPEVENPGTEKPETEKPIPHEHVYVENITQEAACEEEGELTYICKCGDSYKERIEPKGHIEIHGATEEAHRVCEVCNVILQDGTSHSYVDEVVKEPACIEDGELKHTCECGYSYIEVIPATGHSEIPGSTQECHSLCGICGEIISSDHIYASEVTKEPDCTNKGEITHTCECGGTYIELIPEKGHVNVEGGVADCHTKCNVCGVVIEDETSHTYTSQVTKEPKCIEEGIKTYTCDCGYSYKETIPATGHTQIPGATADCHSMCETCGETISSAHVYTSQVTKKAQCMVEGIKTYTCDCGYSYTETIPATGHTQIPGATADCHSMCETCGEKISSAHIYTSQVTKKAQCMVEGIKTYTCDCGYSYTETIPATGHTQMPGATADCHSMCETCGETISSAHVYTSQVTKKAKCVEKGIKTYTCECGYSYTESIPATGHTQIPGATADCHSMCETCGETISSAHIYTSQVTKEPECLVEGITTYTCECGYTYTEEIASTGHSLTAVVTTAAGCKTKGERHLSCDCGYEYDEEIEPTGHTPHNEDNVTTCDGCGVQLTLLNSINFPDNVLLTTLESEAYNSYDDDVLDGSELGVITEFYVPEGVTDVDGLELLTSMTTINLSNNTSLEDLSISGYVNGRLEIVGDASLTSIGFYDSVNLRVADLTGVASVDSITATDTTGLIRIDMGGFSSTLSELTINNSAITELDASTMVGLKTLDIKNNDSLATLNVNGLGITELDLSGLEKLRELNAKQTYITVLDVTDVADTMTNLDVSDSQVSTLVWPENGSKPAITEINVSGAAIANLTFNEVFDRLESITLGGNQIESFDFVVRDSSMLSRVVVNDSSSLKSFSIKDNNYFVSVSSINLSSCSALETVVLNNCSNLMTLSLPTGTGVTTLDLKGCSSMDSLGTGKTSDIENLVIGNTMISSIDINAFTALKNLDVSRTFTFGGLSGDIVISDYATLETINLSGNEIDSVTITNLNALTSLNLSGCEKIDTVNVSGCSRLSNCELENNTMLNSLSLVGAPISDVTGMMDGITTITELDISDNTAVTSFNLSGKTNLTSLKAERCTALTSFDITNCTGLQSFELNGSSKITTLDFSGYDNLTNLTYLDIQNMKVTRVDFSTLTALSAVDLAMSGFMTYIDISNTQLTNFDSTGMYVIETYKCENATKLTSVAVFNSAGIKNLDVSGSGITTLNIGSNTALETLDVSNTAITSIDVTGFTMLGTLDVSNCISMTNLTIKDCSALTSIDISTLANLESFNLDNSGIRTLSGSSTTLDFSNNLNLKYIELAGMSNFTEIVLIRNSKLESFVYNEMPMSSINLLGCTSLRVFRTDTATNLTELDFSMCSNLEEVVATACTNLSTLNLNGCIKLTSVQLHGGTSNLTNIDLIDVGRDVTEVNFTLTQGSNTETNIQNAPGWDGTKMNISY